MSEKKSGGVTGKGWSKGQSGNPGGRPKIENDLAAVGAADPNLPGTTEEARRRWWAMIMTRAYQGPNGSPKGDADWRYAAQELGNRLLGKPKEHVEVSGSITPAESALLAAIRMTPDERMRRLKELDVEDQAALEAPPATDDEL